MNFRPTHDPRNWRTRSRSALTARGQKVCLSQSVDEPEIYVYVEGSEGTLTPAEAFALGTELLNAAMQAQAQPMETAR